MGLNQGRQLTNIGPCVDCIDGNKSANTGAQSDEA